MWSCDPMTLGRRQGHKPQWAWLYNEETPYSIGQEPRERKGTLSNGIEASPKTSSSNGSMPCQQHTLCDHWGTHLNHSTQLLPVTAGSSKFSTTISWLCGLFFFFLLKFDLPEIEPTVPTFGRGRTHLQNYNTQSLPKLFHFLFWDVSLICPRWSWTQPVAEAALGLNIALWSWIGVWESLRS